MCGGIAAEMIENGCSKEQSFLCKRICKRLTEILIDGILVSEITKNYTKRYKRKFEKWILGKQEN